MRWLLILLLLPFTSSLLSQPIYSQTEVEALAQVNHAWALQKEAQMDEPPPGLDSSGMSYERYGEIVRGFLTGNEPELTSEDSAALSIIRAATQLEEARRIETLCQQYGLSVARYRELEELIRVNREFALKYRDAIKRLEQKKD